MQKPKKNKKINKNLSKMIQLNKNRIAPRQIIYRYPYNSAGQQNYKQVTQFTYWHYLRLANLNVIPKTNLSHSSKLFVNL